MRPLPSGSGVISLLIGLTSVRVVCEASGRRYFLSVLPFSMTNLSSSFRITKLMVKARKEAVISGAEKGISCGPGMLNNVIIAGLLGGEARLPGLYATTSAIAGSRSSVIRHHIY